MIGIIFSRDRALQLESTLSSFLLHCQDPEQIHLNVLYLATSPVHSRQYVELAREYTKRVSFRLIPQHDFRYDLLKLILPVDDRNFQNNIRLQIIKMGPRFGFLNRFGLAKKSWGYVLFLVDDNLFVRDFRLRNMVQALDANPDVVGFSLRLGLNTTYCYSKNSPQGLPNFTPINEGALKFNWTTAELDFGYPLEISSSMYSAKVLWNLLNRIPFRNPNTLENRMASSRRFYQSTHPYLLCLEQSATFCNPINKVQTVWDNRSGSNQKYSVEQLAKKFDEGYRVRVESYSDFTPNACHQEVDLILEKHKG